MKTHPECLPCLLRQALQVTRLSGCSPDRQAAILQEVSRVIAGFELHRCPPDNAVGVYRKLAEMSGCEDPYLVLKREANRQALAVVAELEKEIEASENPLAQAVRFAIAGNIIDYGPAESFDIDRALERARRLPLAVDHLADLARAIEGLGRGGKVLYLADNCGEIVYDRLLVEYLYRRGLDITVAVKSGPIINDALEADALTAGLDRYARIIANGGRVPGTVLAYCSPEFVSLFEEAELVIAKGQGNFESLSEAAREIFFLLTIKCPVAARQMAAMAGVPADSLGGLGEMAVYRLGTNNSSGG